MKKFVAACVLLLGCADRYGTRYTVYVDPTFSTEQKIAIHAGAEAWAAALEGKGTVEVRDDLTVTDWYAHRRLGEDVPERLEAMQPGDVLVVPYSLKAPLVGSSHAGLAGQTHCTYGNDETTIVLDPSFSTKMLRWAFMHELGHSMMGDLHTQEGTLMCWSKDCAMDHPTKFDIDRWLSMRGLQ